MAGIKLQLEGQAPLEILSGRSTAHHGTAQHGTARHGTARHGTARHGTVQHITEDDNIDKLSLAHDEGSNKCN